MQNRSSLCSPERKTANFDRIAHFPYQIDIMADTATSSTKELGATLATQQAPRNLAVDNAGETWVSPS